MPQNVLAQRRRWKPTTRGRLPLRAGLRVGRPPAREVVRCAPAPEEPKRTPPRPPRSSAPRRSLRAAPKRRSRAGPHRAPPSTTPPCSRGSRGTGDPRSPGRHAPRRDAPSLPPRLRERAVRRRECTRGSRPRLPAQPRGRGWRGADPRDAAGADEGIGSFCAQSVGSVDAARRSESDQRAGGPHHWHLLTTQYHCLRYVRGRVPARGGEEIARGDATEDGGSDPKSSSSRASSRSRRPVPSSTTPRRTSGARNGLDRSCVTEPSCACGSRRNFGFPR